MASTIDSRADFPNVVAQRHILGVRTQGDYDPQIRTWPRFEYTAPVPPEFHHPMFTRSEVTVLTNAQTNKQTPLKTSNALRYATTLGNKQTVRILIA